MTRRWTNAAVWIATAAAVVFVSHAAWSGASFTGSSVLDVIVIGLPFAGIYALVASGLVVVYTTTGIFNFAQGAIGMFLAYIDWELSVHRGMPQWLAIPLVVCVFAPIMGILLDRLIMRHLQGKPLVVQLMVTVGLMFTLIGLANTMWNQQSGHSLPFLYGNKGVHIGDILLLWHRLLAVVLAIVIAIAMRALLFGSRLGISMRAVVDNRDLAQLTGARSSLLSSAAWAMGCSMAAIGGIFFAAEGDMKPAILSFVVITAFSAAVIGRLRSLPLTYVGALILGLSHAYVQKYLVFTGGWTNVQEALPVIILFIVLLLLPRAQLQFARINVVRRTERVSTVKDTVLGMALLLVFITSLSFFLSHNNLLRFSLGMCTALVALSLVPLTGWAGQVSLAPLAFAGIGAVMYYKFGGTHGSPVAVLMAAAVCVPVGALLALPAMRLQGLYLALATFAFASMVDAVFYAQSWALGSEHRAVQRLHVVGIDFRDERSFLILVTSVFAVCAVGLVAMRRSAFGRRLVALRDSEAGSVTVGVNVLETKIAVFALSAGIAGFGGAFMAMRFGDLTTSSDSPFIALLGLGLVLALVIGGPSYVSGALFAGMFGLATQLIQDTWHLSLWQSLTTLAPGLAVIGVIQNPSGAVLAIGEGFARFIPWRDDARRDYEQMKQANAEPEVGELGISRPYEEAELLLVDRTLGISTDVTRVPVAGN